MMRRVKIIQETADELDLLVLLEKAISFFSHYGKLLAGVALAGMLAGGFLFWKLPNTYTSTLLLQPVMLTSPEQIKIVDSWAALLKKKEYAVLAAQWQIHPGTLKKLSSITVEEIQKTFSPTNYTAFTLIVKVTDTSILPALQKGILFALDNGEYIKDKLAARKSMLRSLIQTINNEIIRLQNMQATIEKNIQSGDNNASKFIVDVSAISSQIAVLEEKKLNYEESLSFAASSHALQNFYTPAKPESGLIKFLVIYFAVGMMVGGAIVLFKHVRRKMKIRGYEK
jgi:hypothetical protein